MGLSPGSTFEFTIWTTEPDALPETLFFRMGIKLSGEFRAVPAESTQDHTLNKFLLEDVYKLTDAELGELLSRSDKLERGNDPRLHHFVGVEPGAVEDTVLPHVINTDSQ
jgi:CRISPR-associated protein Csc1